MSYRAAKVFQKYLVDDLVIIVLEHSSCNALKSLNRKIKKTVADTFKV